MESNQCKSCIYKEMYLHLAKAAEDALRLLIKAQQECEDILLDKETSCPQSTSNCECCGDFDFH